MTLENLEYFTVAKLQLIDCDKRKSNQIIVNKKRKTVNSPCEFCTFSPFIVQNWKNVTVFQLLSNLKKLLDERLLST